MSYEPELGQMIFGQPWKEYPAPEIMIAVLQAIDDELERVMQNKTQKNYPSPFGNTGNQYKNNVFEVQAYSWGDDDQPYNFKWGDLEISWYKWFGRGTTANMEITPQMAAECLEACLASVRAEDVEP